MTLREFLIQNEFGFQRSECDEVIVQNYLDSELVVLNDGNNSWTGDYQVHKDFLNNPAQNKIYIAIDMKTLEMMMENQK